MLCEKCSSPVLGEEIDNGTTTEHVDNFEEGSFSKPLTEGEECKRPECYARKAILTKENPSMEEVIQSTNWREYIKEPQESNKEEDLCYAHGIKDHNINDCIKMIKEPSKKPSERIEELANEVELPFAGSLVDMVNAKCIGIAKYLDELHSQGKTIGCNECGNNIKI